MKINWYIIIGFFIFLMIIFSNNAISTIKSTQTTDNSKGLKLESSNTYATETINIIDPTIEEEEFEKEEDEEDSPLPNEKVDPNSNNLKIANWNLQIFGQSKASKPNLLDSYVSIIDDYDIIFIQEIRNKDQTAFPKLCDLLSDYHCRTSSRAGRSSSKEQYGVIFKKGISISDFDDFNFHSNNKWERPPIRVTFDIEGYELIIYNIHIKPDDAKAEMRSLELAMFDRDNTILLGDLNADCSYYNTDQETDFDDWHWIIKDNEDTTVGNTDCAYDRIIMNDGSYEEYISDGIYSDITLEQSDHYLVWVELDVEVSIPSKSIENSEKEKSISNIDCSSDTYNCGDFNSCSEVLEVFNSCNSDIHRLDRDNDGIPCESLC